MWKGYSFCERCYPRQRKTDSFYKCCSLTADLLTWEIPTVRTELIFVGVKYFTKKYLKRNFFNFREKGQKCKFLYTREFYSRGHQWVKTCKNVTGLFLHEENSWFLQVTIETIILAKTSDKYRANPVQGFVTAISQQTS